MLRHVIAPSRSYTKVSHDIVRHPRLTTDAKLLIIYVQGLPENVSGKALGETHEAEQHQHLHRPPRGSWRTLVEEVAAADGVRGGS